MQMDPSSRSTSLEPLHYQSNLSKIADFPNDDKAQLKARYGELQRTDKGLSWAFGYAQGTTLPDTVKVIEAVCEHFIKQFDQATETLFDKPLEERTRPLKNLQSKYQEATKILQGLKNMQSVYQKRYQTSQHEGLSELSNLVGFFEKEVAKRKEVLLSAQKASHEASNVFQSEAEAEFKDFVFLDENEGSLLPEAAYENYGKGNYFFTPGEGPSLLGKVMGGMNTAYDMAKGITGNRFAFTPTGDLVYDRMLSNIADPGTMFTGNINDYFLSELEKMAGTPHILIKDFFRYDFSGINIASWEQIQNAIDEAAKNYKGEPVIFPIVFKHYGILEREHIASILIKDGSIEYYDPKGVVANRNLLLDKSHTLEDVLDYLNLRFLNGTGSIFQSPFQHQVDAHNCGVFSCKFYYDRLVENKGMGEIPNEGPGYEDILNFRKFVLATLEKRERIKVSEPELSGKTIETIDEDEFS